MKLIQINEEYYIVVDETIDINENDYTFKNGEIRQVSYLMQDNGHIITHSTKPLAPIKELMEKGYDKILPLDIDEVKELIGEVDVEKKAEIIVKSLHNKSKHDDWSIYEQLIHEDKELIKLGYNQALEDNKEKKYTEEDLLNAFREGTNAGALHERLCDYDNGDYKDAEQYSEQYEESFIQSLQPKTEWGVEIVDGKLKLK